VDFQHFDRPDQVERYREAIQSIRGSALSPQGSMQRLAEFREAYDVGSKRPFP
jgi:hypothetical protein